MIRRPTSNPDVRGGIHRTTSNAFGMGKTATNNWRTAEDAYQKALAEAQAMQMANAGGGLGSGGYGGGGGGYGGGGYGGGGGGYKGPDTGAMKSALVSQRDSAKKALPGYLKQYNTGISQIGNENAALTKGYGDQISKIMAQLQQQAAAEAQMLRGDVGAQGGDLRALNAQAGQNSLMLNNVGGAQNAYNLRLAQIMGAATADRKAAGASVNQAASSGIDQGYMAGLMQILGMG